ncbi:MAG TPA: LysM domain-containing protein, partial [Acidimicrobiales bacterium]|nr:LysM domain-containing protein [Acidimicrobiales bacterium]
EPTSVASDAASVVVGPGDTLWGIARQITPAGGDVAATVDRLVARNGGITRVVPGMTLQLD